MKRDLNEHVRELLLKKWLGATLNASENEALQQAEKESKNVGAYLTFLENISGATKPEFESLSPDPWLKQKLLTKFRQKNQMPARRRNGMLAVLRHRVPVYQAAVVAFALAMIFVSLGHLDSIGQSERPDATVSTAGTPASEEPLVDSLSILKNIQALENQKVGRNIREDSLLIRFIITSVELF